MVLPDLALYAMIKTLNRLLLDQNFCFGIVQSNNWFRMW